MLQLISVDFVFFYSRDAGRKIKYNDKVFMDRVGAMGFSSLEDCEVFFRTGLTHEGADALWGAELSRLKQFTNGSREYIAMDGVHMQYGKNGIFANQDLGVSWKAGGESHECGNICRTVPGLLRYLPEGHRQPLPAFRKG